MTFRSTTYRFKNITFPSLISLNYHFSEIISIQIFQINGAQDQAIIEDCIAQKERIEHP